MRRLRHQLSCCAHHYHRRHYRRPQQQLPPAEWVEPYLDTGTTTPSPWLSRVISLVLRTSSSSFSPESLAADLAAFCRTFLVRLSPSFVSVALRSPSLLHQPLLSLHFFHAWSNSTTLNPNSRHHHAALLDCYLTLISSFSSNSGAKTHVIDLVADMRRRADAGQLHLRYLSPSAAAALIRSLAALALVEELLWAWKAMKLAGVEPSVVTYNCLLDGLVSGGFAATADKVFDAMPVRPDVVSYNTLIKGYCRAGGRARDAMVRFEEMQRQKPALAPDKVTYLTLMQCHYNEGMLPQCVSLYQEMEEREELDIPPHAYAVVIGALCKDGKPFEGLAVLERMHKRGCPANVATYTALIDALGKCGREKEAMALFERMKADGLEPDEVTYGVVLNCLCKCQRLDEAMECFRRCIEQGVRVNAIFYASLIDGFGKAGMANQAWELFEEMVEKGFVPDAYCYNVLIDAFVKAGRVDDSYSLYERMESAGCDQTVYTYTILIDGLFREHKNEEALKLWDVMIDKGIAPTAAAFRTLATGLCLSGKFTRACKILDELAPMGVVPETAHEDMINVLCKAGRFKQACKLADGIVQKGREIPGRVRTMMINALRKAGNADLAIKLVHSKIGIGYERSGSIKRRVKFQTLFD